MELNVSAVIPNKANYKALAKEMDVWHNRANDFMLQIVETKRVEKDLYKGVDSYPVLRNCESIASDLSRRLPTSTLNRTTYVCKDLQGKVQAVAQTEITDNNFLEITGIVTHPENIASSVNTAPKVKGAGSTLINHLKELCIEKKYKGIWINPVDSALPFYEKHGFSEVNPIQGFWSLPLEKIQELNQKAG